MEKLRHTPMVTLRECFMFPMKYLLLKNDKSINVLKNKKTVEQNDTILAITRELTL